MMSMHGAVHLAIDRMLGVSGTWGGFHKELHVRLVLISS